MDDWWVLIACPSSLRFVSNLILSLLCVLELAHTVLVKVVKFNQAKQLPDAFRQKVVAGFSADMYASPEIGFRYVDSQLSNLLNQFLVLFAKVSSKQWNFFSDLGIFIMHIDNFMICLKFHILF